MSNASLILDNNKKWKANPFPNFIKLKVEENEEKKKMRLVIIDEKNNCVLDFRIVNRSKLLRKKKPMAHLKRAVEQYKIDIIKDLC